MSFPGPGHVYNVTVVGAGIAGCEAALACARSGLDVLLVTTSLDTLYNLVGDGASLQPPPDTLMADICEEVAEDGFVGNWACHRYAKYVLEHTSGIHLLQSSVSSLLEEDGKIRGVRTWEGVDRLAKRTALCVGSFLEARLKVGKLTEKAGRLSEMAYDDLFEDLHALGFAFEEVKLEAKPQDGSLPYTVDCKRFAPSERNGFALERIANLYGAGVCASGYLSYENAAEEGKRLAERLIEVSRQEV